MNGNSTGRRSTACGPPGRNGRFEGTGGNAREGAPEGPRAIKGGDLLHGQVEADCGVDSGRQRGALSAAGGRGSRVRFRFHGDRVAASGPSEVETILSWLLTGGRSRGCGPGGGDARPVGRRSGSSLAIHQETAGAPSPPSRTMRIDLGGSQMHAVKRFAGRVTAAITGLTAPLAVGVGNAFASGSGVDITPNSSGLPGLTQGGAIVGSFITLAVIASVLGFALSAVVWSVGNHSANPQVAGRGKTGVMVSPPPRSSRVARWRSSTSSTASARRSDEGRGQQAGAGRAAERRLDGGDIGTHGSVRAPLDAWADARLLRVAVRCARDRRGGAAGRPAGRQHPAWTAVPGRRSWRLRSSALAASTRSSGRR